MFDTCKTDRDCSGTILVTSCREISVSYPSGTSTDAFCTATCNPVDDSCDVYSNNGQLAYCAALNGAGEFTTGAAVSGVCLERCYDSFDCSPGFVCADDKLIDIDRGARVCVPGETYVIPATPPYEYCDSDAECSASAPFCDDVSAKWNGEVDTFIAAICTDGCSTDADCPNVTIGAVTYLGTCMPAGTIASTATCAQGCEIDSDCINGFDCAYEEDLVGVQEGYEICAPHVSLK